MTAITARPPAAPPPTRPVGAPRPGRCRATGVSRAGGVSYSRLTTPCYANPAGWEICAEADPKATAAAIRSAVAGCATCFHTHRAAYDACAATPRNRRSPLTVMAGKCVTLTGVLVQPARYIKVLLPRLRRTAPAA